MTDTSSSDDGSNGSDEKEFKDEVILEDIFQEERGGTPVSDGDLDDIFGGLDDDLDDLDAEMPAPPVSGTAKGGEGLSIRLDDLDSSFPASPSPYAQLPAHSGPPYPNMAPPPSSQPASKPPKSTKAKPVPRKPRPVKKDKVSKKTGGRSLLIDEDEPGHYEPDWEEDDEEEEHPGLTYGDGLRDRGMNAILSKQRIKRGTLPVILLIVLSLIIPLYLSMVGTETQDRASIDGIFDEWEDVRMYTDATDDPQALDEELERPGGFLDMTSYAMTYRSGELSLYLQTAGPMLPDRGMDYSPEGGDPFYSETVIRAFVDMDGDAGTGYRVMGLGAEGFVEIAGHDGKISRARTYTYETDEGDPDNWSAFQVSGGARVAVEEDQMELSASADALGKGSDPSPRVVFQLTDDLGWVDSSDVVAGGEGGLSLRWSSICPEVASGINDSVPMMKLLLKAAGDDVTLESLNFGLTPSTHDDDVDRVVLLDEGGEQIAAAEINAGSARMNLDMVMPDGDDRELEVHLILSDDAILGHVAGLTLGTDSVLAGDAGVTVEADRTGDGLQNTYILDIPPVVVLDGAFSDWDKEGTSSSGVGYIPNPNVDLSSYQWTGDLDELYFYMEVDSVMLGGVDVPSVPRYYVTEEDLTARTDSDLDGIPDEDDDSPNDYDNDGKPDSDDKDDDGDGIPDISDDYTGPGLVMSEEEAAAILSSDRAHVFVDSDDDEETGFSLPGLTMGAEYMVEVEGRYNSIERSALSKWTANGWENVKDVKTRIDSKRLEMGVLREDVGLSSGSGRIFFHTIDWALNQDSASSSAGLSTRNDNGFVDHGTAIEMKKDSNDGSPLPPSTDIVASGAQEKSFGYTFSAEFASVPLRGVSQVRYVQQSPGSDQDRDILRESFARGGWLLDLDGDGIMDLEDPDDDGDGIGDGVDHYLGGLSLAVRGAGGGGGLDAGSGSNASSSVLLHSGLLDNSMVILEINTDGEGTTGYVEPMSEDHLGISIREGGQVMRGIGADHRVVVTGKGGRPDRAVLQEYSGDRLAGSPWSVMGTVPVRVRGNVLEIDISSMALVERSAGLDARFISQGDGTDISATFEPSAGTSILPGDERPVSTSVQEPFGGDPVEVPRDEDQLAGRVHKYPSWVPSGFMDSHPTPEVGSSSEDRGPSIRTNYSSAGDGAWDAPGTWTPNGVPSATDNVNIYHTITLPSSTDCHVNYLTINDNGTLDVTNFSGRSLFISADLTIRTGGTLNHTSGTLTFNGNGPQDIDLSATTTFYNLKIDNTTPNTTDYVSPDAMIIVTNILGIADGQFSAPSGSEFTDIIIATAGTLKPYGDISLTGNWDHSGKLIHNSKRVTFTGTGTSNITGAPSQAMSFYYLNVGNGTDPKTVSVSIGGDIMVSRTVLISENAILDFGDGTTGWQNKFTFDGAGSRFYGSATLNGGRATIQMGGYSYVYSGFTFNCGTSEFIMDLGGSTLYSSANLVYYNLTILSDTKFYHAKDFYMGYWNQDTIGVLNTLKINSGATLTLQDLTAEYNDLTLVVGDSGAPGTVINDGTIHLDGFNDDPNGRVILKGYDSNNKAQWSTSSGGGKITVAYSHDPSTNGDAMIMNIDFGTVDWIVKSASSDNGNIGLLYTSGKGCDIIFENIIFHDLSLACNQTDYDVHFFSNITLNGLSWTGSNAELRLEANCYLTVLGDWDRGGGGTVNFDATSTVDFAGSADQTVTGANNYQNVKVTKTGGKLFIPNVTGQTVEGTFSTENSPFIECSSPLYKANLTLQGDIDVDGMSITRVQIIVNTSSSGWTTFDNVTCNGFVATQGSYLKITRAGITGVCSGWVFNQNTDATPKPDGSATNYSVEIIGSGSTVIFMFSTGAAAGDAFDSDEDDGNGPGVIGWADTLYSQTTGVWSDPAMWNTTRDGSGASFPAPLPDGTVLAIQPGHTVTLDVDEEVKALAIETPGTPGTPGTLQGDATTDHTLILNGNDTDLQSVAGIDRVFDTDGNFTHNGHAIIQYSCPTGTITVSDTTYHVLKLSGGGTKTAGGAIVIDNGMTLDTAFSTGSSLTFTNTMTVAGTGDMSVSGGTFTVSSGAVLSLNDSTWDLDVQVTGAGGLIMGAGELRLGHGGGSPLALTGTLDLSSGTVVYDGTSSQTLTAAGYNNLTLEGSGEFLLTAGETVTVAGKFQEDSSQSRIIKSTSTTGVSYLKLNGDIDVSGVTLGTLEVEAGGSGGWTAFNSVACTDYDTASMSRFLYITRTSLDDTCPNWTFGDGPDGSTEFNVWINAPLSMVTFISYGGNGAGEDLDNDQQGTIEWDIGQVWNGDGADTYWSTPDNWSRDSTPELTDNVIFDGSQDGAYDKDCYLDSAAVEGVSSLFMFETYEGTLNISRPDGFTVNGDLTLAGGNLVLSSGTVTVGGNLSIQGGILTGTSDLTVNGTLTMSGGTLNLTGGTITLNGSGNVIEDAVAAAVSALDVEAGADLTVSEENTLFASGATTVDGTLMIDGSYDSNGAFDASNGTVEIGSGGRLLLGSTLDGMGTLNAEEGTVVYDSATDQTMAGVTYTNLEISGGGTKTAQDGLGVTQLCTVSASVNFNTGAGIVDLDCLVEGEGNLIVGAGTLKMGYLGTGLTITGTFDAAAGTVEYDGDGDQQVKGGIYGNLSLSTSGTKSMVDTVSVAGNLQVAGSLVLAVEDQLLDLDGPVSASGAYITLTTGTLQISTGSGDLDMGDLDLGSSGLVVYDGSVDQTVLALDYYGLTLLGTGEKTTSGPLSIATGWSVDAPFTVMHDLSILGSFTVGGTGDVTLSSGVFSLGGNSLTLNGGTWDMDVQVTGSGNLVTGSGELRLGYVGDTVEKTVILSATEGTVVYDGDGDQFVMGTSYGNLTLDSTGVMSLAGNLTVLGKMHLIQGTLDLNGQALQFSPAGDGFLMSGGYLLSTDNAEVTRSGTEGTFTFLVEAGTLSITGLSFTFAGEEGFHMSLAEGDITVENFDNISWDSAPANGSYLTLGASLSNDFILQDTKWESHVFNDTDGTAPFNITTVSGEGGMVAMTDAVGDRAGEQFDRDDGVSINWGNPDNVWDGGGVDNLWSTPENWGGDKLPAGAVDVYFDGSYSNKDCILDISAGGCQVNSVNFLNGYSRSVTVEGRLTVTEGIHSLAPSTVVVGPGGLLTLAGVHDGDGNLTVQLNGVLSITNSTTDPLVGTGTMDLSGTVSYDAGEDQSISPRTYGNLVLSGGGIKSSIGPITLTGPLQVDAPFAVSHALTVAGDVAASGIEEVTVSGEGMTIPAAGNLNLGDMTWTITAPLQIDGALETGEGKLVILTPGNAVNVTGDLSSDGGEVVYGADGDQSVAPGLYSTLRLEGSGVKTTAGQVLLSSSLVLDAVMRVAHDLTVIGDVSVGGTSLMMMTNGELNITDGNTLSLNETQWDVDVRIVGGGNLDIGTGELSLGYGGDALGLTGELLCSEGTISYNGEGDQVIQGRVFGNLKIAGSGVKTAQEIVTLTGGLELISEFRSEAGLVIDDEVVSNGDGIITVTQGTVAITEGSHLNITSGVWDVDVQITGTGDLTLDNSVLRLGGAGKPMSLKGNTHAREGMVDYNGSVTQEVTGMEYGILRISGSGTKTLAEKVTVIGSLKVGTSGGSFKVIPPGGIVFDGASSKLQTMEGSVFELHGTPDDPVKVEAGDGSEGYGLELEGDIHWDGFEVSGHGGKGAQLLMGDFNGSYMINGDFKDGSSDGTHLSISDMGKGAMAMFYNLSFDGSVKSNVDIQTGARGDFGVIFNSDRGADQDTVAGDGSLYWIDIHINRVYAAGASGEDFFEILYGDSLEVTREKSGGTPLKYPPSAFQVQSNSKTIGDLFGEDFEPGEFRTFELTGALDANLGESDCLGLFFTQGNEPYLVDLVVWGSESSLEEGLYAETGERGTNGGRWWSDPLPSQADPNSSMGRTGAPGAANSSGAWEIMPRSGSSEVLGNVNMVSGGQVPEMGTVAAVLLVLALVACLNVTVRRKRYDRNRVLRDKTVRP